MEEVGQSLEQRLGNIAAQIVWRDPFAFDEEGDGTPRAPPQSSSSTTSAPPSAPPSAPQLTQPRPLKKKSFKINIINNKPLKRPGPGRPKKN